MMYGKKLLKEGSLFVTILVAIFFTSCQPDDNSNPNNSNTDNRDAIIGTYTCQESASISGTSGFTVKITKSTANISQIEMDNFYNLGFGKLTLANVNGTNIDIPNQTIVSFAIQGNGSVSGNRINLAYSVNDGTSVDSCTAILVKQ